MSQPSVSTASKSAWPAKPKTGLKRTLTFLLILAIIWGSAEKTDSSLLQIFTNFDQIKQPVLEMIPPDWGYIATIWEAMMVTVKMAVIGTTIGSLLAFPVALCAASNVTRSPWLYYPARFILNLVRTIPELLFAAVFVAIFGLGPLAGIMALVFFSFGIVSKLIYESIEAIDPGPLEAMTAVGASKLQWIQYAVVPQVSAAYVSYVLYTFEVNVRASAVLGMVGAGGIGLFLDRTLNQLRYDRAATIIILTFIIVFLIDFVSNKVRERLR